MPRVASKHWSVLVAWVAVWVAGLVLLVALDITEGWANVLWTVSWVVVANVGYERWRARQWRRLIGKTSC